MSERFSIKVPCFSCSHPHFCTVEAEMVTIDGVEGFKFCVHNRVVLSAESDPLTSKIDPRYWVVASYPYGFAVDKDFHSSKEAAIDAARNVLSAQPTERIRLAFEKTQALYKQWDKEPS